MKKYQKNEDGGFSLGRASIPNAPGNSNYRQMMQEIAAGDAEILPYVAPELSVGEARRRAYIADGVTNEARVDAMWKMVVEGNPGPANALQAKREQIKTDHPGP